MTNFFTDDGNDGCEGPQTHKWVIKNDPTFGPFFWTGDCEWCATVVGSPDTSIKKMMDPIEVTCRPTIHDGMPTYAFTPVLGQANNRTVDLTGAVLSGGGEMQ